MRFCFVVFAVETTHFLVYLRVDEVSDRVRVMILPSRPGREVLSFLGYSDEEDLGSFTTGTSSNTDKSGKKSQAGEESKKKKKKAAKPPQDSTVQSWREKHYWLNVLPVKSESGFPKGQCTTCTEHGVDEDQSPFRTAEGCVLRDYNQVKRHETSDRSVCFTQRLLCAREYYMSVADL